MPIIARMTENSDDQAELRRELMALDAAADQIEASLAEIARRIGCAEDMLLADIAELTARLRPIVSVELGGGRRLHLVVPRPVPWN